MKSKKFQNVFENVPLLNKFVQKVWFEPQTPSIIRLVSSDADYMKLCTAIVNHTDSNAILHSFIRVCHARGIDIRLLRKKLTPVANALGLVIESDASQGYYHILGLTPAASADEIKKSFRQKARTVHPDTNHSSKSQSRAFVKLHEAYQTLSNPESRRHYDQKGRPVGLWNEQHPQNQRSPIKFGYIYMIGGLALFFVTAAFIFDFIFREEVLSDLPYTDKRPPISSPKRATPLNDNTQSTPFLKSETKPRILASNRSSKETKTSKSKASIPPLPVRKAPLAQYHSDSGKQTTAKKPLKISAVPLHHPSANQNSDATNPPMSHQLNPNEQKIKKEASATITIGTMEYIDTDKHNALFPEKDVSHLPPIEKQINNKLSAPDIRDGFKANGILKTDDVTALPTPSPPVLPQSDENAHRVLSRASSTPSRALPGRVSMNIKGKIEIFIKTYCMAYEQKNLKKFASFFKFDAIENGKSFHTLLPQYRHNFARIASITYTIVMHQYSYLPDSTDIKMEGEFFLRWREYGANWKKNSGSIFMHLEQSENSFIVKQLYYLAGGNNNTKISSANQVLQTGMTPLKKKVKKFLDNYCQTYSSKNMTKFASFFRPDATENGKPFYTLLPQYSHNFSIIDSIAYTIIVHRHSRLDAETVKIDGAFSMGWHERNGNQSKNRGSISMVLSVEDNSFRVKELNYRSD
ncbi:DnaJ domain-containing protein [Desulfococcaceae bacterium HSG9]|nr:DnaJ domain-containing protein [Desulfococcaceae bacterium HSG9]